MSWWDTDDGGVTGDQPADAVRNALREIAGRRKPSLEELLRAVAAVLAAKGSEYLSGAPAGIPELTAGDFERSWEASSAGHAEAAADLTEPLARTFAAIAQIYENRWERKPRLNELLEALQFVLGYQPEDYLEGVAGHSIERIEAR